MSHLVGFYRDHSIAEQVRRDLIAAGFDNDDVKIHNARENTSSEEPGFWQSIKEALGFVDDDEHRVYEEASRRGLIPVLVDTDDDDSAMNQKAIAIMKRYGPIDIDTESTQWRREGWTGATAAHTSAQTTAHQTPHMEQRTTQQQRPAATQQTNQQAIPVVQEELQVGKRRVQEGGVRIHNRVIERPVEEKVELRQERVNVERRPVDRPVTNADTAFQERTIEATAMSEQPVVSKQARVVEEVRLNKDVEQRTETVRDTVRRTDVEVEQLGNNPGTDIRYDEFATELTNDQRYRGRDWDSIETDARSRFEQRYPGNKWEQFKDKIRAGYDRAKNKMT
jgi:uncharacterized protein (TIGR02271 family)